MGGFTLVESMITISIAAILLAVGTSSYRYVTNSNRIAAEINGLLGDLQFARSEAIKEGLSVTACVSSDGTNCANSNAWNSGWIVFSDPAGTGTHSTGETIWKVRNPFTSTDSLTASANTKAFTFNRQGYAVGIANNGVLVTLHDTTSNSNWTRCLIVNLNGTMTSAKVNGTQTGSPQTCT